MINSVPQKSQLYFLIRSSSMSFLISTTIINRDSKILLKTHLPLFIRLQVFIENSTCSNRCSYNQIIFRVSKCGSTPKCKIIHRSFNVIQLEIVRSTLCISYITYLSSVVLLTLLLTYSLCIFQSSIPVPATATT